MLFLAYAPIGDAGSNAAVISDRLDSSATADHI
jgi:hypothetical protein